MHTATIHKNTHRSTTSSTRTHASTRTYAWTHAHARSDGKSQSALG